MENILITLLSLIILVAALAAIYLRNMISAILASGLVSLFASILYLLMAAPDVAMTEAAIGAGLSTVIFLLAFKKTRDEEVENG
ncbi:MAG TPA: DUF4040 domain-containing protein [Caldithrix abyssi]|uniref:DUF4040 domain-containing protein n=1 Tax=Caldithrix abyssi TaxID=187145 RepID=A0A7V5RQE9_CALAY|nr:DUF4040 domain-containing protein [Caldithrix abyssi]